MFGYLLLLFTVVPAVELLLLIEVGTHIGAAPTLMIIVLTGVVGATLARIQGLAVLGKIQAQLNRGELPTEDMLHGVMILIGGLVLLTPGFLTDAFGFLLLFPLTRDIIKQVLKRQLQRVVAQQHDHDHPATFSSRIGPRSRNRQRFEDADFFEDPS